MKTRKTLGSLEIAAVCNGSPNIDTPALHQLVKANEPWSIGDKIEIVAVKKIEPKRTLVVPEGVEIVEDAPPDRLKRLLIILDGKTIGWLSQVVSPQHGSVWNGCSNCNFVVELGREPKQTAFEKLADLGWHGFGWKPEEPYLSRYVKFSVWANGYCIENSLKYPEAIHRGESMMEFNRVKTVFIHGWTADGQVDLLKKLTKEEAKNG